MRAHVILCISPRGKDKKGKRGEKKTVIPSYYYIPRFVRRSFSQFIPAAGEEKKEW